MKYLHVGDGTSIVEHDFNKWKSKLDKDTWLYVAVLLDIPSHPRNLRHFEEKEAKIYQYRDAMRVACPDDYNRIFCKVLKKIVEKK